MVCIMVGCGEEPKLMLKGTDKKKGILVPILSLTDRLNALGAGVDGAEDFLLPNVFQSCWSGHLPSCFPR